MPYTVSFKVTVATTASAIRSASQSSDLRQNITAPTAKQSKAKAIVSAKMKAAYALTERPSFCKASAESREGCAEPHDVPVQTV